MQGEPSFLWGSALAQASARTSRVDICPGQCGGLTQVRAGKRVAGDSRGLGPPTNKSMPLGTFALWR